MQRHGFLGFFPTLPGSDNNSTVPVATITIVGLIFGVLVLLGASPLFYKPVNRKAVSVVIVGFSVPSVLVGAGFIIGFILGIIGGAKAIRWKPRTKK